jgi:hypothetical protein
MLTISFSSLILTTQNIQAILTDFIPIYPNLHFTAQSEQNNTINYLDTSIQRTAHNIRITIYRQPMFRDTIIHYCSNYPNMLQLHTYIIDHTHTNYVRKTINRKNIIHNILYNNAFLFQPCKIPKPKQNQTRNSQI